MQELWREKEHSMTRILTLLVGFYVGFIMRTWASTLRYLPSIDALCMAMGSFVVVDSGVDEDKVGVILDGRKISIRQFKSQQYHQDNKTYINSVKVQHHRVFA